MKYLQFKLNSFLYPIFRWSNNLQSVPYSVTFLITYFIVLHPFHHSLLTFSKFNLSAFVY